MTPEQHRVLEGTISHFQKIAAENRFAENGAIDHNRAQCAVCHPELLPLPPFAIYLDVITQSVKIRRPKLDQELVDEINSDLELEGDAYRVTLEALAAGDEEARTRWASWLKEALATGLGLLSIHSANSMEFDLEECASEGFESLIDERVEELMAHQLRRVG